MSMTTYRNVRVYKPSSSRYIGIVFVVILHIALVIFLLHVLGIRTFEAPPPDILTKNIDVAKPKEELPPPPPPDFKTPPPPFVPPPEVNIQQTIAAPANAITTTATKPVAPPPPAPAPVAPPAPKATVLPRQARALDTERWYPAISKRLNEEGSVVLALVVAANGQVVSATVNKSSGYQRLDNAAVAMAMGGGITLTPGTVDGKPSQLNMLIAVRFTIQ